MVIVFASKFMAYFEQLTHAAKNASALLLFSYQYNCRGIAGERTKAAAGSAQIYCLFSNAIFGCALSQQELSLLRQLLLIIATRDHMRNAIGLFQSCKGQN